MPPFRAALLFVARNPRPRFPLTLNGNFYKFERGHLEMSSTPDKTSAPRRGDEAKLAVMHFASTHDTISAERLAAQHSFPAEVIPRPPGTTGRCGVALQVAAADAGKLTAIFVEGGLEDFYLVEE